MEIPAVFGSLTSLVQIWKNSGNNCRSLFTYIVEEQIEDRYFIKQGNSEFQGKTLRDDRTHLDKLKTPENAWSQLRQ